MLLFVNLAFLNHQFLVVIGEVVLLELLLEDVLLSVCHEHRIFIEDWQKHLVLLFACLVFLLLLNHLVKVALLVMNERFVSLVDCSNLLLRGDAELALSLDKAKGPLGYVILTSSTSSRLRLPFQLRSGIEVIEDVNEQGEVLVGNALFRFFWGAVGPSLKRVPRIN